MGELRNHATRRSGSRVFRTSLEARSEVEKKTALVVTGVSGELAASMFRVFVVQSSDLMCHEELSSHTGSGFGAFNSCGVICDGKSALFSAV